MWEFCRLELIYAVILLIGAMIVGLILAYPFVAKSGFIDDYEVTSGEIVFFEGISYLTAIAGPYVSDFLLHFCGRKTSTFTFAIISTILWFLIPTISKQYFWIGYIDRAFTGIILGAFSTLFPLYLSELAPSKTPGFFGSLYQLGVYFGIVCCDFVGIYLDWKNLSYMGGGLCLLFLFIAWFNPDSPVVISARAAPESIFQMKFVKRIIIGIALTFFHHFTGFYSMEQNISSVFNTAKVDFPELMKNSIAYMVIVISAFIGCFIVQIFGRKVAWVISSGGVVSALLIQSVYLKTKMPDWIPFFTHFLYFFFYPISLGIYPPFALAEMLPTSVRSIGVSITASESWALRLIMFALNNMVIRSIGEFSLMITYMGISVCSCVFGFFFVDTPDLDTIATDLYHDVRDIDYSE